ncbi:MAG: phosphoribosylglycinamide formyltransferase, partial [Tidjanibacter sp.]|nr:phosphoribosylglycinamide formyltransferase [Tidjanibacter sp.]
KAEYERLVADRMDTLGIDLVCLAGYMRIVGDELLGRYGGKIVNIHPSLLPAFVGAHAIQDAFDYGVKVFGVTIHYVDQTLDGGKIISQVAVPYEGGDIEELEAMIHKAEHRLYVDTVNKLIE